MSSDTESGEAAIRYLSRRGWQGEPVGRDLIVRRWVMRGHRLCLIVARNRVACEVVGISPAAAPPAGIGALLGSVRLADGRRWSVLRGNPAHLPEIIPLIDSAPAPPAQPLPQAPSALGRPAVDAMIGITLLRTGELVGSRYEPDGRWLVAHPLQRGDEDGRGGVRVAVGHWLVAAGMLCHDAPGLAFDRRCFQPEQWGPATFRLRSDRALAVTTLVGATAL